jgi:tetratricopeptide (TPR) repeat protein
MSNQDDRWLWFIDDAPLQALLKAEGELGTMRMRAASSPGLVRAMTFHLEGRTAQAAVELRTAIDGGESQPEAFLFLGQIHFEARQFDDALAVYRQLLQLDPTNASAAFNAAVCLERLSRWSEAADLFRSAVKTDPDRSEAWLGLGLCSLHQRRPEEALKGFDRYLAVTPDNESALFGRAVALQMLRRFDDAAAIYERFRSLGEPSAELLTNLLALAVARKDSAELSEVATELGKLRPGHRQAAEALAYAAIAKADWEQVITLLAPLSEADPLPADWSYALAYAYWQSGRPADARTAVTAILAAHPAHAAAHLLHGVLLEDAGAADDALSAFRKAAANSPDSDPAAWNMARLAASLGRADVCRLAAKSLLDRNRNSAEGWFASGLAALVEERFPDAIRAFSEALRLRREWPEAEWNLGLSLLHAAEPAKAFKSLERIYPTVRDRVSPLPLARAALLAGEPARALEILKSSAAIEASPELLYNLAVAFHDTADLATAEDLYRRLLALGVPFADAHINLGHVLLAAGRPDEAEELWTQARELESAA